MTFAVVDGGEMAPGWTMRAVFKYLISFQGLEALDLFLLVPKISPYSENK